MSFDPSKLPSYSSLVIALASLVSSITLGIIGILVARLNNPLRADNLRAEQDAEASQIGARWAILNAILLTFTDDGKFRERNIYSKEALLYALENAFASLDCNCRLSSEEAVAIEAYEAYREYRWGDETSPLRNADLEAAMQLAADIRRRTSEVRRKQARRTDPAFWNGYRGVWSMLMDELQRRNRMHPNPPESVTMEIAGKPNSRIIVEAHPEEDAMSQQDATISDGHEG